MAEQITEIVRLYLGRGLRGEPHAEDDDRLEVSVDPADLGAELGEAMRQHRRLLATLQGPLPASPEATGAYRVPTDRGDTVSYSLEYASLHLEAPGSTDTELVIEKSSTPDDFTAETVVTLTVPSGDYLAETSELLGNVESGNLIRYRWASLGTGADNFHIQLEGTRV